MKIFITGIRGFLGSSLARHWLSRGHEVAGSSQGVGEIPGTPHVVRIQLGEPFDPKDSKIFSGFDLVVHAAHDFTPGAMEKNVRGTQALAAAASAQGVARQIFLSSYSAREDSASEYGRTKHQLEKFFLELGQAVLSPGLVVGNGGLFVRQRTGLLCTPIMPVLGKGDDPVALIALDHFLQAATVVAEERRTGDFRLFYDEQPAMHEYMRAVKEQAGQRIFFLPIPTGLALLLVRAVRALGFPIPIHPDQIRAIAMNRTAPWRSDLPALLPDRRSEFNLQYALSKIPSK